MPKQNLESKHSAVTLLPHDEEKRKRFLEFRKKDVVEMFKYQCINHSLFCIAYGICFIKERDLFSFATIST